MTNLLFSLIALTTAHACPSAEADHHHHAHASAKAAAVSSDGKTQTFGKGITLKEEAIPLQEAVKRKDELKDKEILVKAKVEQVCQNMGCWLTLKDGKTQVRVTFSKDSFFVPKNSAKKEALVQGKIFTKELSASEARHYAKEAGLSAKEVAKIQQPVASDWFDATGLTLTKN